MPCMALGMRCGAGRCLCKQTEPAPHSGDALICPSHATGDTTMASPHAAPSSVLCPVGRRGPCAPAARPRAGRGGTSAGAPVDRDLRPAAAEQSIPRPAAGRRIQRPLAGRSAQWTLCGEDAQPPPSRRRPQRRDVAALALRRLVEAEGDPGAPGRSVEGHLGTWAKTCAARSARSSTPRSCRSPPSYEREFPATRKW